MQRHLKELGRSVAYKLKAGHHNSFLSNSYGERNIPKKGDKVLESVALQRKLMLLIGYYIAPTIQIQLSIELKKRK